jgi:hypothetical protein
MMSRFRARILKVEFVYERGRVGRSAASDLGNQVVME